MEIAYIPHERIDFYKWDRCILESATPLIYARSFYLNRVCPNWDALVYKDYQMVMPVCRRKKYTIHYLYQPAFTQQHGIFSKTAVEENHVQAFIHEIKKRFKFARIAFNYAFPSQTNIAGIKVQRKENFILPLTGNEFSVRKNYNPHFEKSLRRLQKLNLQYVADANYEQVIDLYQSALSKFSNAPTKADYNALKAICKYLHKENNSLVRYVCTPEGERIAAAVLLRDENRLYNLVSWNNLEGKQKEANYFLYDKIIQEFEGKVAVLDLEGSDLEGVAQFYKKMNPISQPYYDLHYNHLPRWIRMFKQKSKD